MRHKLDDIVYINGRITRRVLIGLIAMTVSAQHVAHGAALSAGAQGGAAAPRPPATTQSFTATPLPPPKMTAFIAPPFAGISVLAQGFGSSVAVNMARYNAGNVNAIDTPEIRQSFVLKNTSSAPLTIARLQPSCHCTTAVLSPTDASSNAIDSDGYLKLESGESALARVSVDVTILPPGALNKLVSVYLAGSTQPAAMLQITGELMPSVTIAPALIDFGQMVGGESHTLQVTANVDERLAQAGKLPALVSSDAAIKVRELPQVIVIPGLPKKAVPTVGRTWVRAGSQTVEVTPRATDRMLTRTYEVVLPSTMPLGPVNATLSFAAPPLVDGTPAAAVPDQAAINTAALLRTATVLVMGQVTGDVSAQPTRLAFGTVDSGQVNARQILLNEMHAGVLQNVRIMASSPWLSTHLVKADARVNPFTTPSSQGQETASYGYRVLDVTLSPDAPVGNLSTQIKLMLGNGQQLIIPVNAFVRSGS